MERGFRAETLVCEDSDFIDNGINKFYNNSLYQTGEKLKIKLPLHSRGYELQHGDVVYFSEFFFNNINKKKIKAGACFALDDNNNFIISDKENAYFIITQICQIEIKRYWWQFWKKPVFKGCNMMYIKE